MSKNQSIALVLTLVIGSTLLLGWMWGLHSAFSGSFVITGVVVEIVFLVLLFKN